MMGRRVISILALLAAGLDALRLPTRRAVLGAAIAAGSLPRPPAAHAYAAAQQAVIARAREKREAIARYEAGDAWLRDARAQLEAFDAVLAAKDDGTICLQCTNWDKLRDALASPPLGNARALLKRLEAAASAPADVAAHTSVLMQRLVGVDSFIYTQQRASHKDLGTVCAWCPPIFIPTKEPRELVASATAELDALAAIAAKVGGP